MGLRDQTTAQLYSRRSDVLKQLEDPRSKLTNAEIERLEAEGNELSSEARQGGGRATVRRDGLLG